MKANLVVILLTFGARSLLAQFTGSDDFAGAAKDTSKWGADIQVGSGTLSQSGDGLLRFSAAGSSDDDVMEWPWIVGDAPFASSWSIQADVHVPVIELADGYTAAGIGIGIRNSGDTSDSFGVNLENVRSPGESQQFNFYNRLRINGSTSETSVAAPSVQAAVRISWNASTKTLSAEYDADGAVGGYAWTVFNTFDPTANDWNMTGADSFQIFIRGYAEETAVTLGDNVYLDNFSVSAESDPVVNTDFTGLEDFAGSSKNSLKWGAHLQSGSGLLSQTGDGMLRFSAAGNSDDDVMEWPWIVGDAPFTSSWSIQADVHVPVIELADGYTAAGIGIGVRNSGDPRDSFGVNLENVRSPGEPQEFNFYNRLRIDGSTTETSVPASQTLAAVRVTWDASTQTLTAEYDANGPVDGYNWTVFKMFDPTANNWNMTADHRFRIFIRGYAEETAVTLDNNVYLDNFFALDGSRPSLSVSRDGANVLLAWPRLALGYKLEASTTLTPEDWSAVSDPPVITGEQNTLSLGLSDPKNFFRLKK